MHKRKKRNKILCDTRASTSTKDARPTKG